jgi:hypothetical protein
MPVEVKGLDEVLKALRQFEPDLAKNLNKQVRAALTPVQKKAQSYVPDELPGLSNWTFSSKGKQINRETSAFGQAGRFPKFNASIVKRGIRIMIGKTKPNQKGFSTFYRISNLTAAGAIMETAGRANPAGQPWNPKSKSHRYSHSKNPEAGLHFINSMGARMEGSGKRRGRLIYRAYNEDQGKATASVMRALDMTIAVFHRRAEAQTLRKVA